MRLCSYEGCGRKHDSRGYCAQHAKLHRQGHPMRPLKDHLSPAASLRERLDYRTDKSGDCWGWTGAKAGGGYGYLRYHGRSLRAHRVAYELTHGPIGPGKEIDHMCRNRGCVNPSHLQQVSSQENSENLGVRVDNKFGVRGVSYCKQTGKYAVQFKHRGTNYWGGRHATIKEAEAKVVGMRNALCTNNLPDRASQSVPYQEPDHVHPESRWSDV